MLKTILNNWLVPAILLVAALFVTYFFGAAWAGVMVGFLFCLMLALALFTILRQQKKLYSEGRITRRRLILNVLAEIMMILVAMSLAGLLGRILAGMVMAPISHGLVKFIVGMALGLLAGMGVGYLVKRTWGRVAGS